MDVLFCESDIPEKIIKKHCTNIHFGDKVLIAI